MGESMLIEFRVSNYKGFEKEIIFPVRRSNIVLGNCGSGKTCLAQAIDTMRKHYNNPPQHMQQEDFFQLCMEKEISMQYTFLFDAGRLVYNLQWTGKNSAPQQKVTTGDGLSFNAKESSICQLAGQLGTQRMRLAEQWQEFVQNSCFLQTIEKVHKKSLLIADNFAADIEEEKLDEYRWIMERAGSQFILLSSKAAVLDMKEASTDEYFILNRQGLYPLVDLTQKALDEKHNLRKLWKAGTFSWLP